MTKLEEIYYINLDNSFTEYDSLSEFDMPDELEYLDNEIVKFKSIIDLLQNESEITIAVKEENEEYKIYSVINSDNPYIEEYEGTVSNKDIPNFLEEAKCIQIASGEVECFHLLNKITDNTYSVLDSYDIGFDYE